jgi:hypothetical protein
MDNINDNNCDNSSDRLINYEIERNALRKKYQNSRGIDPRLKVRNVNTFVIEYTLQLEKAVIDKNYKMEWQIETIRKQSAKLNDMMKIAESYHKKIFDEVK